MNTYSKLMLDEIQATANILAKYINDTNFKFDDRINVNSNLERAIECLDTVGDIVKCNVDSKFNN